MTKIEDFSMLVATLRAGVRSMRELHRELEDEMLWEQNRTYALDAELIADHAWAGSEWRALQIRLDELLDTPLGRAFVAHEAALMSARTTEPAEPALTY